MREQVAKHTFNISKAAEELVPNKANRNAYLLATILAIVNIVLTIYFYPRLPERLPLLMTNPWGEARLVPRLLLMLSGVLIILINILNILLGKLWGGGNTIPRILSIAAVIFAVAMTISLWGVIQSFFL